MIRTLAHLILLPIAGWAIVELLQAPMATNIIIWFVVAVIAHDLILLPLYSGVDGVARRVAGTAVNYIRVPAGLSLLMLLVFWSTIRGKGEGAYHRTSGIEWHGYGTRWLLASAALFALSGAVYLARTWRT